MRLLMKENKCERNGDDLKLMQIEREQRKEKMRKKMNMMRGT